MKKLLFLLSILLITNLLEAQTLHAYVFCATDDGIIGEGAKVNLQRIKRIISDIKDKAEVKLHSSYEVVSVANIKKTLQEIESTNYASNDIILFYYSGHGTNSTSPNEYPNFMINGIGTNLNLKKIHNKLIGKNANVVITLADCCNFNGNKVVNPGKMGGSKEDEKKKEEDINVIARYRKLFKGEKINILACSSEQDQFSVYNRDFGGFFTSSFDIALFQTLNRDENEAHVNWKHVLIKARDMTVATANEFNKTQNPVFETNIRHEEELQVEVAPTKKMDWGDDKNDNSTASADNNAPQTFPNDIQGNKHKNFSAEEANRYKEQNLPNKETIVRKEGTAEEMLERLSPVEKALVDSLTKEDYEFTFSSVYIGDKISDIGNKEDIIRWNKGRLREDEEKHGIIVVKNMLLIFKKKIVIKTEMYIPLFFFLFFLEFGMMLYIYKRIFLPAKKKNSKKNIFLQKFSLIFQY